jgi:tripartite-type tricarboxylate transporter receptor subunit TctC
MWGQVTRRELLGTYLGARLAGLDASGAFAQAAAPGFPDRPLRLIVPYAPGGATDILGRSIAERLGRDLGQPVAVENRPGANTIIGTQAVAQAAPDGLTLLVGSGASLVLNPLLYRRLPYDPERDLRLLAVMVETPLVMVVNPALPVSNVQEFVRHAREQAGALNYASVGLGNPIQLAAEMFRIAANIEMTHVPYAGSAPALLALAAGDVHVMFDVIATSLQLIRDGRLRALAVTTRERLVALPDVPTITESGYPDYQATTWFGVAVPKQVPPAVAERLRQGLRAVQEDQGFRNRFEALGLVVPPPRSAEAVSLYQAEERERWARVIRARGISLD